MLNFDKQPEKQGNFSIPYTAVISGKFPQTFKSITLVLVSHIVFIHTKDIPIYKFQFFSINLVHISSHYIHKLQNVTLSVYNKSFSSILYCTIFVYFHYRLYTMGTSLTIPCHNQNYYKLTREQFVF
jgi:hypothetical protein